MNITLDQIMPEPLASINHGETSIWGNKVVLEEGKRILLNASSGKGKTTFTTTTMGLRHDYTGTISYGDRNIQSFTTMIGPTFERIKFPLYFKIYSCFQSFQLLRISE